ncbi:MAG: hypothetical protein AAF705_17755, partial [Bacteroidota bacterium]
VPDLAQAGYDTFPLNLSTLVYEYEDYGVDSEEGLRIVGNQVWFKNSKDGLVYKLSLSNGSIKSIGDNRLQLKEIDWSSLCTGYLHRENQVFWLHK